MSFILLMAFHALTKSFVKSLHITSIVKCNGSLWPFSPIYTFMQLYLIFLSVSVQVLLYASQFCYQIYINFTNFTFQKAHKDKKVKIANLIFNWYQSNQISKLLFSDWK